MELPHTLLILNLGINNLYKLKNYIYAGYATKKYLKLAEKSENKPVNYQKMKKVLKICQKKNSNVFDFNFKEEFLERENWFELIDLKRLRFIQGNQFS